MPEFLNIVLVNLETGDVMRADYYAVVERGMPEGYVAANSLSLDQWITLLEKVKGAR